MVANCDHLRQIRFSPTMPFVFTEHGALMAASVLNTPRAVEVTAAGRASFAMDGKMIDVPVVIRAQRPIARYEKIVEREKRTVAAMKG